MAEDEAEQLDEAREVEGGAGAEGARQLAGQKLQQTFQVARQLEHERAAALRLRVRLPARRLAVVHLLQAIGI